MISLHQDLFFTAGQDVESGQYRVLAALQSVRHSFARTIIYPYLSELVKLHQQLGMFLHRTQGLRDSMPKPVKGVDWEKKEVIYESKQAETPGMDSILTLVEWGLPHIKQALDEGKTIFEFVDDNLDISTVGIQPAYQNEGYLILLNRKRGVYHVLRYRLSMLKHAKQPSRSLSTRFLCEVPLQIFGSTPEQIKQDLRQNRTDLPNPATYFLDAGVDFPFEKTLLPVAKRKFMRLLSQQPGLA